MPPFVSSTLSKLLHLNDLDELYRKTIAAEDDGRSLFERLFHILVGSASAAFTGAAFVSYIAQQKSAFNFRDIIDNRKIFLVNLAKGRLGEDVTALLGSLLMHQVEVAALSRAESPEPKRRDYFLYVDEAHLVARPGSFARQQVAHAYCGRGHSVV